MIAIQFQFPTGKMHATPWGRQVNEGAVEWPPSPWRILRALLSVWHHKFSDVGEGEVCGIITALSDLPSFCLPPASLGHSRHYMPTSGKSALIFDTFIVVPKHQSVVVCWQKAELTAAQTQLLSRMLAAMNYFGRSESWVDAQLLEGFQGECNAVPLTPEMSASGRALARVLAPEPEEQFLSWRKLYLEEFQEQRLAVKRQRARDKGKPVDTITLTPKEVHAIDVQIPASIFQALQADTSRLRKSGWNRPPGSRYVEYVRPSNSLQSRNPVRNPIRVTINRPTLARYAVTGKVLPRLTEAVRIGERVRTFLMGCSKQANSSDGGTATCSAVFAGKNADGTQIAAGHTHAHYLCEAIGNQAQISHINVYAPAGFDTTDRVALSRLNRIWGDSGHDLQLVLLGIGDPMDFGGFDPSAGQSSDLAGSCTWISRTPYVPTHHLKIRRSERTDAAEYHRAVERELAANVRLELRRRSRLSMFAQEVKVTVSAETQSTSLGGKRVRWMEFTRERKGGGGRHGGNRGYGVRLTFPDPITGPVVLGYGCHFGLGQFTATTDEFGTDTDSPVV